MQLLEPGYTPYDLNFRIFNIPVRVHPMFWVIMALFGWNYIHRGLGYVFLWVACGFVSILVHELGHVLMGQLFGNRSHIVLYSFGGLAVGSNRERYRWQRVAVCFAGPLAGFLLFGLVCLAIRYGLPQWDPNGERPALGAALGMLFLMNLFWNALNLLPIWPLDGGQISREICVGLSPGYGLRFSLGISLLLAGLLAVHVLMDLNGRPLIPFLGGIGGVYTGIFFAMLAVESFQMLQQVPPGPPRRQWEEEDEEVPWDRGPKRWD